MVVVTMMTKLMIIGEVVSVGKTDRQQWLMMGDDDSWFSSVDGSSRLQWQRIVKVVVTAA